MLLAGGMTIVDDIVDDEQPRAMDESGAREQRALAGGNAASKPLSSSACDWDLVSSMMGKKPVYPWICPLRLLIEFKCS